MKNNLIPPTKNYNPSQELSVKIPVKQLKENYDDIVLLTNSYGGSKILIHIEKIEE